MRNRTQENREYNNKRNNANIRIRTIQKQYWEKFTNNMKRELYGSQEKIWRMLRKNKLEVKHTVQTNTITLDEWKRQCVNIYGNEEVELINILDTDNQIIAIKEEIIEKVLKPLKTKRVQD